MIEDNISINVEQNVWTLREPFSVSSFTWHERAVVKVTVSDGRHTGMGEGTAVFYKDETHEQLFDALKTLVDGGESADALSKRLPLLDMPGGAKNALDCALWDLKIKREGFDLAKHLGVEAFRPLTTVVTVGLGGIESMSARASRLRECPILKVKLGRERDDDKRILAVRKAAPNAQLVVDANQGWSLEQLNSLHGAMAEAGVEMIEQPLKVEDDAQLANYTGEIPLCADESCQTVDDLTRLAGLYQVVNIKLDKTGGLTGAIALAKQALDDGFELMVGNMLGSSLAMAPAHAIGQLCKYVDLDGPLLLADDHEHPLVYRGSNVFPPTPNLWG